MLPLLAICCWSAAIANIVPSAIAAELPALKPLPPLRVDLAAPGLVIVAPSAAEYQQIAARLREGLSQGAGRTTPPRIVADDVAPADLGAGPVLVLGNLMDSRLARKLYLEAYDFTDFAWPSAGGHVVRTIRDPFGTGAHIVMVGGSDVAGVGNAARSLLAIARERGPVLGYVNDVKLGQWADQIRKYTASRLSDADADWLRSGNAGSWDYQHQIGLAAIGYLRTGDVAYLARFKRELRSFFDHDVYHPKGDSPTQIHGYMNALLIPWDLVRDHEVVTDAERLAFDNDFLFVFRSGEGPSRIASAVKKREIRNNHGTRTALDAFFAGRYFTRRYGLAEGQQWMDVADRYFAPHLQSGKPTEDSWGHQWAASMLNVLSYYMAAGRADEYVRSDGFKMAADRALIAHAAGSPPLGYMAACAVASGDSGYLSGWRDEKQFNSAAEMSHHGDEYLRSFCTGAPVKARDDLLGVGVAPLDRLWYDTIDKATPTDSYAFVTNVPYEATFDKISLRTSWANNDYYLLLDGISGGGHAFQDANCIVRYEEKGYQWLRDTYEFNSAGTVREQNGVYVAIDASGPGKLHRYARKLYAGTNGDYWAVGSALEGIGEVDWERHIVRSGAGAWTLVIDRAVPGRPGEVLAERHWHVNGTVTLSEDELISQVSSRCLHLQTAGVPADGFSGTNDRVEIVRARAVPRRPLEIATLLYVNRTAEQRDLKLTRAGMGWQVMDARSPAKGNSRGNTRVLLPETADGLAVVDAGKPEARFIGKPWAASASGAAENAGPAAIEGALPRRPKCDKTNLPWTELKCGSSAVTAVAIAADGTVAAGDAQGNVVRFAAGSGPVSNVASLAGPIRSLHFIGNDLLAGDNGGAIVRFAPVGTQRWRTVIPYVPIAWAYWSERTSRAREISSADVHGDGHPMIFVANADRRLYGLDDSGKVLWKTPIEWGIFTAMTPGTCRGHFALYGGASRPAIFGKCMLFDEQGKTVAQYFRPDLASWSNPSQFRDLRLADVDGNGAPQAIVAVDTNCRQLSVWKEGGKLLWDADVAGSAEAVAVDGPRVWCASGSGYVCCFEGRTGKRLWVCYVGEPTNFVAPLRDGRVLAAAPTGMLYLIGSDGNLIGADALGCAITAPLRPGEHRAANAVVFGLADGRVVELAR